MHYYHGGTPVRLAACYRRRFSFLQLPRYLVHEAEMGLALDDANGCDKAVATVMALLAISFSRC
ncbi:hypothetical protein [Escherichia coli]|uniref:hypothetical protein n=1 Tax=Escherichia coli TaxID=562 RepID=UPI0037DC14E7